MIGLRIAQGLIGIVVFLNLQAAVYFMFKPADYAPGFELSGVPGEAMIRGLGLLFLMWNIPYLVALVNPFRHFVSYIEAVVMQAIGVTGETLILITLSGNHPIIHASVIRFIIFDGAGLLLLLAGLLLVSRNKKELLVKKFQK
jgi:hypothetical protein